MFQGQHPYFKHGQRYTHQQYCRWTAENNEDGAVLYSTMKGRLSKEIYCTSKHLLSVKDFLEESKKAQQLKGCCADSAEARLRQSRLESSTEKLSQQWLSAKL